DPDWVNGNLQRIRAVTVADVQRVAKTYFAPERRTRVWVEPKGGMLGGLLGGKKKAEDEGAAPPPGPSDQNRVAARTGAKAASKRPEDFPGKPPVQPILEALPTLPQVRRRLDNGLQVVVVPNDEVPFVSLSLGFEYGSWAEKKAGVAAMTLSMLTQGTKKRSAKAMAEELEFNAISLGGSAGSDSSSVSASCLTEKLPHTMELLAEVLLAPSFPKDELKILRNQTITGLMMADRDAGAAAGKEMRRRLYGSHPYARTTTGEMEDVKKITRDDLAAWWKRFARPDAATLYVGGDVEPEEVVRLAQQHLGGWKAEGPKPAIELPPIPEPTKTHIVLVDRPGSAQSEIRAGHISLSRAHEDWHASRLISSIFGVGMDSRLSTSLRVEKGLTYGAFGGLQASRFAGTLSINTSTKTPRTAEAVRAILEVLQELRAAPPTAEELDRNRSFMVGQFAGRWETAQAIVRDLWFIDSHDLPADYFQQALDTYRKVSAEESHRIAKEHIRPDRLTIVVVGDASRIRADLLKVAPVEVVKKKEAAPPVPG
ncbi:MAG: insulinase family protein, partial [Planctomycetota bacterium]